MFRRKKHESTWREKLRSLGWREEQLERLELHMFRFLETERGYPHTADNALQCFTRILLEVGNIPHAQTTDLDHKAAARFLGKEWKG